MGYVLGLDIGVASIGWWTMETDAKGCFLRHLDANVHLFEKAVDGDFDSGRDESKAKARRDARSPRRMTDRRRRRRSKILNVLIRGGLLPAGDVSTPQMIHEYIVRLDNALRSRGWATGEHRDAQTLAYRLRAEALDRELQPDELGRALYNLAQRRGFLSNRKSPARDTEEDGDVKKGITELTAAMKDAGARTLGEYFTSIDPETERIRQRWTARSMYMEEFDAIWDAQKAHHPELLTDEFREKLHHAIFFQRPLKSHKHLIGKCSLFPTARRALMADRLSQRFRLLQRVNDLRVRSEDFSERGLTPGERSMVLDVLSRQQEVGLATLRGKKYLKLPRGDKFNFEFDDDKKLIGHRTDAKLASIFGDHWSELSESEKDEIALEIASFQNTDALVRRAQNGWGLDEQTARVLGDTQLEPGYAKHCRKAMRLLLGEMEKGVPYASARRSLFPESFDADDPLDRLPPVRKVAAWRGSLRNPTVERTLTELRKVVNEVVRQYGKPDRIHIELARDIKRSRKERKEITRDNTRREKARNLVKRQINEALGLPADAPVKSTDVTKALLWEECNGVCPFTGRTIDFAALFGDAPQFDIEHIIPRSRSLDNSFLNKTLCYHEENRSRKGNRTPFEAFSGDTETYEAILARVRNFKGDAVRAKLRRFEMKEIPEDWLSRHLNDTRYASKLAADYVALLFGGRSVEGKQRVFVSTGVMTAHLRRELQLDGILGTDHEKNRSDHRHHAIDALVVALITPGLVKRMQDAAEQANRDGSRRMFASIPEPWPDFMQQTREQVDAINVSRRLDKKVSGPLHEETNYSKEHRRIGKSGKPESVRYLRKRIDAMTDGEAADIVDPLVRKAVLEWRKGRDLKTGASDDALPRLVGKDGVARPIRKARFAKVVGTVAIGRPGQERHVKPGSNHHTVVVANLDAAGNEKSWDLFPITMLEAYQRSKRNPKQPVIQRDWGPQRLFKFSICPNEYLQVDDENGGRILIVVLSTSKKQIECRLHHDGRSASEARKKGSGARIRLSGKALKDRNARKVHVTHFGKIVPAND